ncbi:peroxidase-related enzyme [Marinobacter daepoensis]|uniref:Peroxidase-related enzyme n=1 Tax=Marinobacter daepoensis TaxID=262077 RepID=A0ABS3BH67_9GAMM|nr:peroxidase-related enzyme [Marinobacter daepoensis]MBN7770999.1 peroxidase-related enzyme [Marinobacter daepoensis]MBY6033344.1 peroxidase-related enzyme [Marinobacter daepoensis]MBY6078861.1 peroxidase-related enzyme [Marinobacter daepoensis]
MSRIPLKSIETSCSSGAEVLSGIKKQLGMLPNFFAGLANHLGSLNGYLAFHDAMERESSLSKAQQEMISLAIANANGCHYCVSGHTLSAKAAGVVAEEARRAQKGQAEQPEDQALLTLALEVLDTRGHVSEETLAMVKAHGFSESEIVEVVGWVGLNSFSNWINNVIQPKIDFPVVPIQE